MTELLVRPADPTSAEAPPTETPSRPRWPLLGGVLAAGAAAAVGLGIVEVLVTVLGLGDGRSNASFVEVLHVGAALWLLAHGATLQLTEGGVTLIPLGVTALAVFLLHRGGRAVARRVPSRGRRGIPAVAAAVAVPYALLQLLLATALGGDAPVPSVPRAGVGSLLIALGASGLGAAGVLAPDRLAFLRRGGRVLRLSGPAPSAVRVALRAALVACAVLAAGAAVLAGVSIASHLSTAADLAGDTTGGTLGTSGVLVVQLALLPNLLLWFVSYAVGPGFSVGSDTSVQLVHGRLGEVPALPMFGGLPGELPVPLLIAVVLVPVVAGVLAGRVVTGRLGATRTRALACTALAVGPVAGVLMGAAVALASGRVLGGGLADVGASAWRAGLAIAVEVGLIALLTALLTRAWRSRRAARRKSPDLDAVGAHRRDGQPRPGRLHRPGWLHGPGWLHRPGWLRLPAWRHRPERLPRRPRWLRRRRKVVELPD